MFAGRMRHAGRVFETAALTHGFDSIYERLKKYFNESWKMWYLNTHKFKIIC
jgi:hypothetical protein